MKKNLRKILYTPSGRAGAYANGGYAVNLFKGCAHGCLYCYVPGFCRIDRTDFHAKITPAPDVLERLYRDCERAGILPEPIFMCFTCDPYPSYPGLRDVTRKAIEIVLASGNAVNVLTKGGLRVEPDLPLLASNPRNRLGATLTFRSQGMALKWEPGAPGPGERMLMLKMAKDRGISTWASIEPVIIPEESLAIMEMAMPYVDEFKIGKWNHDERADAIDWRKFLEQAEAMMIQNGKKYIIKQDLIEAAGRQ